MSFAIGTKVGWTLKDGTKGTGEVITAVLIAGHPDRSLVAVDPIDPAQFPPERKFAQSSLEFHPVICCTDTWLTGIK